MVKAMDDGKGWAHDDENGNFEILSCTNRQTNKWKNGQTHATKFITVLLC